MRVLFTSNTDTVDEYNNNTCDSNCFCMSQIGNGYKDTIELTCGCLIHYDCLIQYIRMQLGDKLSLMNSIPSDVKKEDAGVLCPYHYAKDCKSEMKVFITISEMEFLSTSCIDILSSLNIVMEEERLDEKEIDKLKSWLQEEEQSSSNDPILNITTVDFTTDAFISATTKPCPSCKMPGTHYHGHACHHISPNGGCSNCHTHYCYRCLSTEQENITLRNNRSSCLCGFWSSFCQPVTNAREIKQHIKLSPYPHDKRCGCPICPDCSLNNPCGTCPGDCIVCMGILIPGPRELDSKVVGSFTWGKLIDAIPIYKRFIDACRFVNLEEIKSLMVEAKENNQNLNVQDNLGRNALHYLSDGPYSKNRMECFNLVVDEFPQQVIAEDYSENTPLHNAAHHGNEEAIKKILTVISSMTENHEYINIKNSQLKTPFAEAASGDFKQCCQLLLQHGAKVHLQSILPQSVKNGYLEIVELLLARISTKFDDFRDLLSLCLLDSIKFERFSITKLFLTKKAGDINHTDNYKNSGLHYAVSTGKVEIVKLLTQEISIINNCDVVSKDGDFIDGGVNIRNYLGETPLIKASRLGYDEIVDLLLLIHPDVTIKDNNGKTAEQIAKNSAIKDKIKIYCEKNSIAMPLVTHKKKKNKDEILIKEKVPLPIKVQSTTNSNIEVFRVNKQSSHHNEDIGVNINDSSFLCESDTSALQQAEEIEVLESIFDDKLKILRPPPKQIGDPTCKFQIFITSIQSDNNVHNKLSLIFTMSNQYPTTLPLVAIDTGDLSLFDFNFDMQVKVKSIIEDRLSINSGEVCAFDIIQAVTDFMSSSECLLMRCS